MCGVWCVGCVCVWCLMYSVRWCAVCDERIRQIWRQRKVMDLLANQKVSSLPAQLFHNCQKSALMVSSCQLS